MPKSRSTESSKGLDLRLWALISAVVLALVAGAVVVMRDSGQTDPVVTPVGVEVKDEAAELYNQGKWEEALPELERYVAANPTDAEARSMLARALWLADDLDAAEDQFLAILELDEEDSQSMYQLGLLLRQKKDSARSIEYLEEAASLNPNSEQFQRELGDSYALAGEYDKAIAAFEAAVAALVANGEPGPVQGIVYGQIGDTFLKQADKESARQAYQRGLQVAPDNTYLTSQLQTIGG